MNRHDINICEVDAELLELILPLIACYQRFYEQEPDCDRNRDFFSALLKNPNTGIQFAAFNQKRCALGFATLYFLPSSLSARAYCVLNDLYTDPMHRNRGVGRQLIDKCRNYALQHDYSHLDWMTQSHNVTSMRLYDSLSAERTAWYYYSLPTKG